MISCNLLANSCVKYLMNFNIQAFREKLYHNNQLNKVSMIREGANLRRCGINEARVICLPIVFFFHTSC